MRVERVTIRITRSVETAAGSHVEAQAELCAALGPDDDPGSVIEELSDAADVRLRKYLQLSPPPPKTKPAKPMPEAKRQTTEPAEPKKPPRPNGGKCTEKQIRCIHGRARDAGIDPSAYARSNFGVEHLHDLTMSEASNLIDELQTLIERNENE